MSGENNSDYQTYYVPEQSYMAISASVSLALAVVGVAGGINSISYETDGSASWFMFAAGLAMLAVTMFIWFGLTIKENLQGMNSEQLKRSYRIGMQWFIFSEVMFFACFFGVLFYVRTFSGPWLAGLGDHDGFTNSLLWNGFTYDWPMLVTPQDAIGGVDVQAKLGHVAVNGTFAGAHTSMAFPGWAHIQHWLPVYNTLLLVLSSVWCEIAHHALKKNQRKKFNIFLGLTLLFGFTFVYVQYLEYHEAYVDYGLTLGAGVYGATFFMLTGFHGFHVCLGAFMLLVQWIRSVSKGHFTAEDHFGFEASAWYWHFVDVVWIFLVVVVYLY
jgi:cytochrome c oxidase subunit 3